MHFLLVPTVPLPVFTRRARSHASAWVGWCAVIIGAVNGCAVPGDLRANINLPAPWPAPAPPWQPSQPPEPSTPRAFPPVLTLAHRTGGDARSAEPAPVAVAMLTPSEPAPTQPAPVIETRAAPAEEALSSDSLIEDELGSGSLVEGELSSGSLLEDELESEPAAPNDSLTDGELSSDSLLAGELGGEAPATDEASPTEELSSGSLLEDELGDASTPPAPTEPDALPTSFVRQYPKLADGAPAEQREFAATATRAVDKVYNEDVIDTAVLESLQAKLARDAKLAPIAPQWQEVLREAVTYAETMQKLGWVVRHLRRAFGEAKYDPELSIYRGIDMVQCREAFAKVSELGEDYMQVPVRVPPAEPQSLASLQRLCQNSHALRLLNTELPKITGPKRLRQQLQKAYQRTLDSGRVRKVTITDKWSVDPDDEDRRTLRGTVAVQQSEEDAFPNDPCTLRDLVMVQTRKGKRWKQIECCEVENIRPVACEELR